MMHSKRRKQWAYILYILQRSDSTLATHWLILMFYTCHKPTITISDCPHLQLILQTTKIIDKAWIHILFTSRNCHIATWQLECIGWSKILLVDLFIHLFFNKSNNQTIILSVFIHFSSPYRLSALKQFGSAFTKGVQIHNSSFLGIYHLSR